MLNYIWENENIWLITLLFNGDSFLWSNYSRKEVVSLLSTICVQDQILWRSGKASVCASAAGKLCVGGSLGKGEVGQNFLPKYPQAL